MSERTSLSQPFVSRPSQSPNPALHAATSHVPTLHAGTPAGVVQTLPHMPQLLRSVLMLISHPVASLPSQSAHPTAQLPRTQRPEKQEPAACG